MSIKQRFSTFIRKRPPFLKKKTIMAYVIRGCSNISMEILYDIYKLTAILLHEKINFCTKDAQSTNIRIRNFNVLSVIIIKLTNISKNTFITKTQLYNQ